MKKYLFEPREFEISVEMHQTVDKVIFNTGIEYISSYPVQLRLSFAFTFTIWNYFRNLYAMVY